MEPTSNDQPKPDCRNRPGARFILALGLALIFSVNAPAALHRDVLVFIPAYEGSQLYDADLSSTPGKDPTCVWGTINDYFSRTLYLSLRMPNPLQPRPLLRAGPLDVYGHFVTSVTSADSTRPAFVPYTLGADFFIFSYDWRQDIATVTAPQFARAMEGYARLHAQKTGLPAAQTHFILVSHSMGGLVARTWLSENPAWAARLDQVYLVGTPNRGSVKAVRTVLFGPDTLAAEAHGFTGALINLLPTGVDQNVTKLTGITRPSLYELLPYDDPNWVDSSATGQRRSHSAKSLLEASTWEPFWPSAALEKRLYLDDWLRKRIAEGRKKITPSEWEFCQDPAYGPLKKILKTTANWRARQGTLQHTAALLTRPGESTRLRLVLSTGLSTPSGVTSSGEHDNTRADYTYAKGNDGDGTVEAFSVLDGFPSNAPNVKVLSGVTHGKLMIDPGFLTYLLGDLSGQTLVPLRASNPLKPSP